MRYFRFSINLLLVLLSGFLGWYFSYEFGELYDYFFDAGGSWVDLTSVSGLPLAYVFFLTFLLTAFWQGQRIYYYIWLGVLLISPVIFELYFDLPHVYFPLALGIAGWLIGWLLAQGILYVRGLVGRKAAA